jgi:hypothetical protein
MQQERSKPAPAFLKPRMEPFPNLNPVIRASLRRFDCIQKRKHVPDVFHTGPAGWTGGQVLHELPGLARFAIVTKNQFIFVQVSHRIELINGSRTPRIFLTARKMLCLAALVRKPSA